MNFSSENFRLSFTKFSRNYFLLTCGNYTLNSSNYEIKTYCISINTYPTSKDPCIWDSHICVCACLHPFHNRFLAVKKMTGAVGESAHWVLLNPSSSKCLHLIMTVVLSHNCYTWTHSKRMFHMQKDQLFWEKKIQTFVRK